MFIKQTHFKQSLEFSDCFPCFHLIPAAVPHVHSCSCDAARYVMFVRTSRSLNIRAPLKSFFQRLS